VANRPVYYVPTVRMHHGMTDNELYMWCRRIDQIIQRRLDRKGIIHTVSYDRRNLVILNSDYRDHMISHETKTTVDEVKRFKSMPPPAILVSPSVSTGWDFPMDECRYQIIGKVALVDTRDRITAARCRADNEYSPYIAVQDLVQAAGRGSRTPTDYCETFIPDDQFAWLRAKYKKFFPQYFLKACKTVNTLPDPRTL
jgi:Rad3-related DNA helicase